MTDHFQRLRKQRKATICFVMHVRLSVCNTSAVPIGGIFVNFDIADIRCREIKIWLKPDNNTGKFTCRPKQILYCFL
jgi:hypothetical protein